MRISQSPKIGVFPRKLDASIESTILPAYRRPIRQDVREAQVDGHQERSPVQEIVDKGEDADVKQFAEKTVPTISIIWMRLESYPLGRHRPEAKTRKDFKMLYWALVFLLIAIVAGAVGFGGVAVAFAGLAKIIFFIFLVLLVISLVAHVRA